MMKFLIFKSITCRNISDLNTLRPRLNRRPFADDIFKCIFLNEDEWISPRISLKFASKVRIDNIPSLVQIMAWRRSGDKPLFEPMMVSLPTHICVPRPQWVKQRVLHIWSKFGVPGLNRSQVISRTHRHTDRHRQWQYPKDKTGLE